MMEGHDGILTDNSFAKFKWNLNQAMASNDILTKELEVLQPNELSECNSYIFSTIK